LKPSGTKAIRISLDEFCEIFSFGASASPDVFRRLLQATDSWFTGKGYKGALPSFFAEYRASNSPEFEIVLLSGEHYQRREIALRELKDLNDVEPIFRQVHSWAVKSGFASGFPTFDMAAGRLQCVVVSPEQAEVREVPVGELNLAPR
jgi:hypothetical protein